VTKVHAARDIGIALMWELHSSTDEGQANTECIDTAAGDQRSSRHGWEAVALQN